MDDVACDECAQSILTALDEIEAEIKASFGAKRFNPNEPRNPLTGEWIDTTPGDSGSGSVFRDVLKLAGRIDLADDERLLGSGRIHGSGDDDIVDIVYAVIDGAGGRELRLGTVPADDVPKWRGANLGGTVRLDEPDIPKLRNDLVAAEKAGRAAAKEIDRIYAGAGGGSIDAAAQARVAALGVPYTSSINAQWGDLVISGQTSDEEPTGWSVLVEVVPADGSPVDGATFVPKDLKKLVAELDRLTRDLQADPSKGAKSGGAAAAMSTKHLNGFEIKNADRGEVSAVIATFGTVDADGDVTLPGAFKSNGEFPISAYNHTSWGGALPVGVASIRETDSEAIIDGQFFLDTAAGRDTFTTVKRLHERGLGEWSYGYDAVGAYSGQHKGQQVRFLPQQVVHEASPVLRGAGIGTRTVGVKSRPTRTTSHGVSPVSMFKAAIRPHETDTTTDVWDAASVVGALGTDIADLRAVHAWVDGSADPETKGAYKLPHHHGAGGAANVRACVAGIAALNGARGGTMIPESDRKGVYEHLAAHLRDADREPPELRSRPGGELKFQDECAVALVSLGALIDRASEVVALRSLKGKSMAAASEDLLNWVYDEMRRLKSIIDTPQEDFAREYARYIKSLQG